MTYPPLVVTLNPTYALPFTSIAGATYPLANLIIYVPLRMPEAFTVKRVVAFNVTANGNRNIGLYSSAGSKLWEIGSTGMTGANQTQFTDVSPDQSHAAGLYYLAIQHSNTTGNYIRSGAVAYQFAARGVLEEAAGSFALPSTATWTTMTRSYVPAIGLDLRG